MDRQRTQHQNLFPSTEYPFVGNLTQLSFNVQDLKTGSSIKNETATVTVINNSTANVGTGINKGTPNEDFFNI